MDFDLNINIETSGQYVFRCIGDPNTVTYSGSIKYGSLSSLEFSCNGYTLDINKQAKSATDESGQQPCRVFDTEYLIAYDAKA